MGSPLVSVILPYYNAGKALALAINSLLNQTFSDFELILVNNNSIDSSIDVAKRFAASDPRIRLMQEPQQGVVFAANTGMLKANGKYIARMDADDVAHPERLKLQFDHLESNLDISISATQVKYKTENESLKDFSHFVDWSNSLTSWEDIQQNLFVEFPVINPTLMFRRSMLREIGDLKDGHFPEDYEWFLRAIEIGHKVEKLPIPLLDWQDSETRLTRTDSRYESDAFFQIKTEYLAKRLKTIDQTRVWIWGAGRLGYKRSQLLLNEGIEIAGYIDIKKEKQLTDYPCIHFEEIDRNLQPYIISYISNRGKREEVRSFLNAKGYHEGVNYIIAG
ncbi:MAG: glycosyltransferase family 2 protein [Reichenbachiella sp.]|uniref:glycosyltransferase family 2 protein n=1 Tax=Reichenbachiella sp. TaxID=2184521 RepID=UPI003267E43A